MPERDPSVIETLVVRSEELVTALEARERDAEQATLRATAPFSGRMRARLHVEHGDEGEDPSQVLVPPERAVDDDCPSAPHPDETADAIRADPDDEYSVDRHHERHRAAMRAWRERVPDHAVDRVTLSSGDEVDLVVLDADRAAPGESSGDE